ncbi:Rare lipoprotein B family protein [Luminiphilus syltensis NOR5-1B]|uniref:LPS-assembly lipoprotein LptE n=1 Tax=Luminiphilus syltensis NOR5-1B TaxID=565045 RepID=B8KRV7_9GAMM|nr:LPS assembly lipoprotein LptE [Luminiphilus syltensis]EED34520.1 Rare lipoprotein B family protein [Luminiphilus syltensis NOR5-1B]
MMRRRLSQVVVLLAVFTLAGCGFYLRGSGGGNSDSLSGLTLSVVSAEPSSELTAAVLRQLRLAGAEVVDLGEAELRLKLAPEVFQRRNISLTAQARAAEVELTIATRFDLLRADEPLVTAADATVVRQMLNDPENVVGKVEELRLLRAEMRQDLAGQIVRRTAYSLAN